MTFDEATTKADIIIGEYKKAKEILISELEKLADEIKSSNLHDTQQALIGLYIVMELKDVKK